MGRTVAIAPPEADTPGDGAQPAARAGLVTESTSAAAARRRCTAPGRALRQYGHHPVSPSNSVAKQAPSPTKIGQRRSRPAGGQCDVTERLLRTAGRRPFHAAARSFVSKPTRRRARTPASATTTRQQTTGLSWPNELQRSPLAATWRGCPGSLVVVVGWVVYRGLVGRPRFGSAGRSGSAPPILCTQNVLAERLW